MRARLRPAEVGALVALAALSVLALVLVLVRAASQDGTWVGGDGFLVTDQLQYLNWLRQAGDHVAVANLYDLAPGPHSFVHPGLLISGLLDRLGTGMRLAYLLWKPVAVAVLFLGALVLCRRFLASRKDRVLALVLALFACSPVSALVGWTGWGGLGTKFRLDFAGGELWSGAYLWGYLFTAIAVGAMPLGFLAYERGRRGGARRLMIGAALAGLVASWLQPWQGATYALVLVVAELGARRVERRSLREDLVRPGVVLAATALPLAYFFVLSRLDDSWRLAGVANEIGRFPWWAALLVLAPLGVPALLAYRRPRDWGEWALMAWIPAGLLVFVQPAGTFPAHAFQGLELPLAVLAVRGVRERVLAGGRWPAAAALVVVGLLVVPGTAYRIDQFHAALTADRQAFVLRPGERAALRYVERAPRPGGVLAPVYSGTVVPAWTGRETWIGAGSWTPDFDRRNAEAEALFAGRLRAGAARALVRRSGAAFLLADCHHARGRALDLGGAAGPPRRFGCAAVYPVRVG